MAYLIYIKLKNRYNIVEQKNMQYINSQQKIRRFDNNQDTDSNNEEVIVKFQPDGNQPVLRQPVGQQTDERNKILEEKQKKLKEAREKVEMLKNRPITRERIETREETKKDENDMANKIPLTKRIQRKEEEALGKTDNKKSFTQLLEELSDNPEHILMTASSVFPYRVFPETIVIDPVKVKVTTQYFFKSQEIRTVLIKDILEASVQESPFVATLQILIDHYKEQPLRIQYLKKEDAEKAAKIIQGLVIARSEAPDISKVEAIR